MHMKLFVPYSDRSELTTSYTADDRSHLFGAVRQYSICVKISQSTLVPLKSVKSLRTYTRQQCTACTAKAVIVEEIDVLAACSS